MKGILFIKSLGLHVQLGNYVDREHGYLAGTDLERLEDFHNMISDSKVKGIFFARGGYGTARIVPSIDYDLIKAHPKIIWGYSDITYLHNAIQQYTGLVTFHGPMVASDLAKDDFDVLSRSMFQQLFQPTNLIYSEYISPLNVLSPGQTEGPIVGGNLSVLISTLGTPYEIDTKDKILLIEDIGEEPYRVDSMLQQLFLAGKIHDARAVLIGDFADTETDNPSFTMDEVFHGYLSNITKPVMSGFKIGHCFPHFSIPLGAHARLCTDKKRLTILPGVK